MTQVVQRNNHVLQTLKRLKETLENEKKKYADKVNVLVMTWERIAASAREQRPLAAICIVEKMYKDTLGIMLQGDWPKMSPVSKTHLMQMLSRCRLDLCKEIPWLHGKFRKLLELVNDPWTLPSLKRILHKDPSPATPEQIMEFCKSERGLLIVMRLTMLCSNRCEKVAIRLAEACFGALSGGNVALLSLFTTNEYNFIFDIYLCLLYKYKKLECIINALKSVSVADGYYMVLRLRKRSDLHDQKIWKFSNQVAAVAARYFVTVSMLSRNIPNSALLKNLIIDWLSMCNPGENNVENEVRKVMQPAETSEHIYLMAEVLTVISQRLGNQMYSSLIMELYIRAVTADINYLERVKLQNDKEQMTTYEKHLASKFLALADLVKDHSGVRREFVLTAFSIHPSADIYRRVEEEAVASGKVSPHSTPTSQESIEVGVLSEGLSSLSSEEPEGKETATDFSVNNDSQDSGAFVEISNRCPLHLPYDGIGPEGDLCFQCGDFTGTQTPRNSRNQQQKKKERSLDALILIKGNTVTESLNYDVLSAPSQVLEAEKLGLSPQVCADLVTLLGSNRYHLLTWVLEWSELSSRCLRYMDEADTIKSGKKELKFLEIDYNQYKDWPENDDEGDCIEKGYEQWLEEDETDFDTDSKRSNTDDSEEMMIKTAIKRSQKQMGRYAESSSESDDSRSRPRNKKRGRPKKQKYFSDSGSVSDSLGSDGQKQKRLSKKHSTKSNDLRKTLGKLKVLEMAGDASHYLLNNDSLSSSMLNNKMFNVPNSNGARSDPTVLKSLRAFRPNAHKTRSDEFVQSMTENCLTSKQFCEKIAPINSTVFDCNDNKFVERFSLGNKDMELHFRTSGVRTIKYNDMIRTIKEDLMSVSNIPSVVNNPTVNVVHVHDYRNDAAQVFQSTADSSAPTRNVTAIQKPKSEESQGSQSRKPTSSQSLSQSEDTGEVNRFHSTTRPSVSGLNVHNVSTSSGARPSARMTSPQYTTNRNQNIARHIPLTSNSALVNLLNAGTMRNEQNFNNQGARISAQSRTQLLDSRNSVEGDGNVANKNFTSQNIRTAAPTLFQHVVSINKNINTEEVLRGQNSSMPSFPENSHQNASRLPLEPVQASPSKPIKKTDLQKLLSEPNSSLSTPKPGSSVKYTTANDVQFLNRNCPAKSAASFSKNSNVNTVKVPPQAKTNSLSSPTVILQTNASVGNKNPSDGTKRSHANPVVRVNNLGESNNSAIQESVSPRFTLINNFSNPSQLGGNAAFGSTSYTAPNVGSSQGTNTHEQVATTQTGGILTIGPPVSAEPTSSNRNILATVLKRNFTEKVTGSKYSETRNSDAAKNEVAQAVNQNAKSIRNTVPNPPQQNVIGRDSLNYVIGDMIERVVHQELNAASQSVMSPVRKPDYKESSQSTKRSGQDTQTDSDKKVKSSSSLPEVQTESGFIKKQVLNNQKITILVQNDGERDKPENVQKTKLNDVLFRDDQKTCITFRAIKRTQSEKSDESPVKKKSANGNRDGSSNPAKESKIMENSNGGVKAGESSSEPLCQYLVLEAINDPSGALPKFNQAFGKSYQIKIPQAVKPVESTEGGGGGGGGGSYDVIEQGKSDSKIPNEQRATSLLVQNEVPVTASPREGNTFDIVQKPVKSVYIDKEIKQPAKSQERSKEGANVSTIQMTEVQQPGANAYPNTTGKVARSSVVQQLLRKVPGPALQAVNSVNPLPARQVKTQDVVPSSTVFYATEACSQPQIVIQRTVGRVNTHNVGQVTQMAPVIYTQSPSFELAPQTQTLLLAAVPTGTHGVVPGTQLVRLPPTSGVWKMAPTVSTFSPRIFQLRPQNLVLQGSQEQGLIMQSAQPVFLHHLTSLPLKPINVVPSETKTDKVDVKNDVYIKPEPEVEEEKMCSGSLEMDSVKIKRENISPVPETSEHETVSLMKDIKEFENVFEETKLKFEMEEQQESIIQTNTPLTSGSNSLGQSVQQTVLVQPQLMLHKPQMIITSAIPNQQTIFTQKIEKPGEKEPEKTVIFATNTKIDNSDNSRSRVAVAYVNQAPQPAVSVQKPLVVVTNFSQATSPVPSVTSQNSSSPNSGISSVSFSGTSNSSSKTPTKSKSKHAKSVSILSKSPPAAKPQQKPQEDASTAQKIYAILEEYAVQLRNSPDMNNRPAPRRRSNPPSTSHPRKKKQGSKSRESFSDGDETEPLPSSEDSSSNATVLQEKWCWADEAALRRRTGCERLSQTNPEPRPKDQKNTRPKPKNRPAPTL